MPKEHRKRGRREEKKRKREEAEGDHEGPLKRQKSLEAEGEVVERLVDERVGEDSNEIEYEERHTPYARPGELPYYGILGDDEQEYFKRADSMLELNQFADPEERDLFLMNVYKEANSKELKIANSQSCSRLMERLILLSTPDQLKVLFQKFSGHFLNLVQHRFASHCCEALFLKAAPIVTQELVAPPEVMKEDLNSGDIYVSMENLFLYTLNELEGNLGYLMTDQFASHPLRVLLVVLSGKPLAAADSTSLLQSKKKEHVSITGGNGAHTEGTSEARTVPDSFHAAVGQMIAGTTSELDTTSLRALAMHPIANPVLQLLLELELSMSGKQCVKDPHSLFSKLLPDDLSEEGTESASFVNGLIYDTIGSRLLEVIVTRAPGKTYKVLYNRYFGEKLGTLAKNEIAAFVVTKIIERLNKEDLQSAVDQLSPHIETLTKRSRTSVIKTLIERCRVRGVDTQPISGALETAYGQEPSERLMRMLKVSTQPADGMAEDRRKQLDAQDSTKAHGSLLAQCMLDSPGSLREFITDGLLAMETPMLLNMAKDRTASRVLQSALTCAEQSQKFCRVLIPRFYRHIEELAVNTVASHVVDSFWEASEGLMFIRERIAKELAQHEPELRASVPGRAVWRNWKMDIYKTKRNDYFSSAKGQEGLAKTSIELARERFAAKGNTRPQKLASLKSQNASGANRIPQRRATVQEKV